MNLKAYTYSFPFKSVFKTSTRSFNERKGIILEWDHEGILSLGEAAPLPGFSVESLSDVKTQLTQHARDIQKLFLEDCSLSSVQTFCRKKKILPSLRFALETLAVDYLSQRANIPVQEFLFEESRDSIKINSVISAKSMGQALDQVRDSIDQGFETVKMKVGIDFQEEFETLQEIRSEFPKLTIRLDANQAWDLEKAINNLEQLKQLNIEYCEEPLTDPSIQNLKKLSQTVPTPVALDESLLTFQNLENVVPHISVMVIKPMVFGSLTKLFATNRIADTHDIKVIYTTSLESGIGRTMTAILAAGLGDSNSAHGLGTGSLLKMDVWHDGTYINNGSVCLPDRIELGEKYHSNHKYLELDPIDLQCE